MKKLKLKALELGAKEVLTRAQLKNVLGGDGSGGSGVPNCLGTYWFSGPNGCGYVTCNGWNPVNPNLCTCQTSYTMSPPCGYA